MKIQWTLVLQDYLLDETLSYQKLADKYNVSKRSIVRHAQSENWKLKREQIQQQSTQNVTKNSTEFLTEVKKKHIELAQELQNKALEAMASGRLKIKNPYQAVRLLEAGIRLERECWQIQKILDSSPDVIQLPDVPVSKEYKSNMEKIEELNKQYEAKMPKWLENVSR